MNGDCGNLKINLVAGRIFFAFISGIVIAISGGGSAFINRPVGASYLTMWIAYWLVQATRKRGEPSEYDKKQRWVYLTGAAYIPLLIVVPSWEYANFAGPIPRNGPWAWAGLALFACGILVLAAAMRVLGRLYTSYLGIQREHRLVTSGVYRYIRHPGYLGEIISMFGVGLSLGSVVGLVLAVVSLLLVLVRIGHEEEMLIDKFGDEYTSYMKRTKRLIPLIY